ncbi:hypothetical protein BCT86_00105 [Vibrio breoganii]|uniref:glycosyltransferase family 2 protein n=1 Tax=Vibrio breoganii TaxID=553239 RepID=UPI000C83C469|nr:sugar transferase [Vibrio breoganii]PML10617.1 hypothetical protein BCT86_00105 [Vibrio breoganii]
MRNLSPIALFVYDRPDHVEKTIAALKENELSSLSDLIIYSDFPKTEDSAKGVELVRSLIKNISGFKTVRVIEQPVNKGLAMSITEGVTRIVEEYGKVIVLEDDIITGRYFLKFMNDALDFYENNPQISSISAYNYPADLSHLDSDTYLLRVPLCWGWATWKEEWSSYRKDLSMVDRIEPELISYINFDNTYDYFSQAVKNVDGRLNTWFIFWYLGSAKLKKLTLFPRYSLANNIGHDGTGQNSGSSHYFNQDIYHQPIDVSDIEIKENAYAFREHKIFFNKIKRTLYNRIKHRVIRHVFKTKI